LRTDTKLWVLIQALQKENERKREEKKEGRKGGREVGRKEGRKEDRSFHPLMAPSISLLKVIFFMKESFPSLGLFLGI
jgi:hypothetical protein